MVIFVTTIECPFGIEEVCTHRGHWILNIIFIILMSEGIQMSGFLIIGNQSHTDSLFKVKVSTIQGHLITNVTCQKITVNTSSESE
jgi:hypothetical protein